MAETKIPVEEATREQLITHARDVLNLDFRGQPGKAALLSMIREADLGHVQVTVADAAPEPPAVSPSAPGGTAAAAAPAKPVDVYDERVRVTISTAPGASGDASVPVGVNGDNISIMRGEQVAIKRKHAIALHNAMTTTHVRDPETGQKIKSFDSHAYPVTFHDDPFIAADGTRLR